VPQTSENVGGQYRFPISSGLQILTRADFIVKGRQYWDPENSAPRDAIELLNLRLGLEDTGGKWTLTGKCHQRDNSPTTRSSYWVVSRSPAPGREYLGRSTI